jgi:hypothetical protein
VLEPIDRFENTYIDSLYRVSHRSTTRASCCYSIFASQNNSAQDHSHREGTLSVPSLSLPSLTTIPLQTVQAYSPFSNFAASKNLAFTGLPANVISFVPPQAFSALNWLVNLTKTSLLPPFCSRQMKSLSIAP